MPIISTDVGIYSAIDGVWIVESVGQMREAMERLYHEPMERAKRGRQTRQWVEAQNCRIKDKIDWLENDMQELIREKNRIS